MRQSTYFITGTDTNIGKTYATLTLMQAIKQQGYSVIGMKPIASGCELQQGTHVNEDALLLQAHGSIAVPYSLINPYSYLEAVSPHIAGIDNPVNIGKVAEALHSLQTLADKVFVEGAGGWYAPINAKQTISDLVSHLALPIIMVVGIRLGCINHAYLTYQAIIQSGLNCVGWIANCIEPTMLRQTENIDTLKEMLHAPLLGILPYSSIGWTHTAPTLLKLPFD